MAGSAHEVFTVFLRLGCTAIGGPLAHLAAFRRHLVEGRAWLDAAAYARLVALCQVLPGPTSSQVGLLIGWERAGWRGAIAAWAGFTLPSALILACAGWGALSLPADRLMPWMAGIELGVIAIVAEAIWRMGRSLCPDPPRAGIALLALAAALVLPANWGAPAVLAATALAGAGLPLPIPPRPLEPRSRPGRAWWLALFALALALVGSGIVLAALASGSGRLLGICLQAGGLVFGGGHVVLPLLQDPLAASGLVGTDAFLAGYGLVQILPGPLFSLAAYAGAVAAPACGLPTGVAAALALVAVFLPGQLLALGLHGQMHRLASLPRLHRALTGVEAGVVGLLAAACWDPLLMHAVRSPRDLAFAAAALAALIWWRLPAPVLLAGIALAHWAMA